MASFSPASYSVPVLLRLLRKQRGEAVHFFVGTQPTLTVQGHDHQIDGPVVDEAIAEEMLHAVASTRQIRDLRERGMTDFIHSFEQSQFLVRAIRAFGQFRLDIYPLAAQ
jgi:hypothetical protein